MILKRALAQEALPAPVSDPNDFISLIQTVGSWLFTILMALAVVVILGSLFTGTTRKVLTYAIVAIVIATLAGGAALFIENFITGA